MFDKNNMKWILLGAIILIIFGMQGTLPKEAVADVQGQPCAEDTDCPCWGEYTYTDGTPTTAYGIGIGTCTDAGICDVTWCYDVESISNYLRDHPWEWLKGNPSILIGILGLILLMVFWPKH